MLLRRHHLACSQSWTKFNQQFLRHFTQNPKWQPVVAMRSVCSGDHHSVDWSFRLNEPLWRSWSRSHYHLKYRAALPHGNVWTPVPRVLSSHAKLCSSRACALSAFMGDSHQHLTPRRHPTPLDPTHAGSPPCPCCVATSWPNDVRL